MLWCLSFGTAYISRQIAVILWKSTVHLECHDEGFNSDNTVDHTVQLLLTSEQCILSIDKCYKCSYQPVLMTRESSFNWYCQVEVVYLMAKACLHAVINYLWLPEPDQIMLHLSHYHQPVLNSKNSVKTYKFRGKGQFPWLGSKFCVPRKTVVPTNDETHFINCRERLKHTNQLPCLNWSIIRSVKTLMHCSQANHLTVLPKKLSCYTETAQYATSWKSFNFTWQLIDNNSLCKSLLLQSQAFSVSKMWLK